MRCLKAAWLLIPFSQKQHGKARKKSTRIAHSRINLNGLNDLNCLNVLNGVAHLRCARFAIVTSRPPVAMQASTRYIQK